MNNHFHLVVETPRGNLVEGMRWFLAVYTNRYKEFGHVFSGRYKALLVGQRGIFARTCWSRSSTKLAPATLGKKFTRARKPRPNESCAKNLRL
jgi:hypothetical protein